VDFGRDVLYVFTIIDVDINTHVVLARRGMHVGMRIGFEGGRMRKTRDSRE
jgi:hypothetical protein